MKPPLPHLTFYIMATKNYDVYIDNGSCIAGNQDDSLVLIKFPSMRSRFENDRVSLSMQPKNMKLKLEMDNRSSNEESSYSNVYTSSRTQIDDDQLYVGYVVDGKIMCRRVCDILTMRSDFSHLDIKEEVPQEATATEEIKPISVKFSTQDRQNTSASIKSFQSIKQENEEKAEEPFKSISFKHITTREAAAQRAALFGKRSTTPLVKQEPMEEQEHEDYKPVFVADIKPKMEKMDCDDIYSREPSNVKSSPRKSGLVKQHVKTCLLRAKVISFNEAYLFLVNYCKLTDISEKDILDGLVEYAVLVQGNWIIKSEVLHGDSSVRESTDVTGISINLFVAARDYLLWLFTQNRLVSRVEFSKKVKMNDYDVLDLFNQVAILRRDIKKWEFKLPTDLEFLSRFPDVVQRQATFWKVRRANKLSMFEK